MSRGTKSAIFCLFTVAVVLLLFLFLTTGGNSDLSEYVRSTELKSPDEAGEQARFPEKVTMGQFRFEPLESGTVVELEIPQPAPPADSPGLLLPSSASYQTDEQRFVFYRQNDPPRSALFIFPTEEEESSEGIPLQTIELGDHLYHPLFSQDNLFLFESVLDLGTGDQDRDRALQMIQIKRVDLSDEENYPITGPVVLDGELDDVVFLNQIMLVVANEGPEQDNRRVGFFFDLNDEDGFSEPQGIPLPGRLCAAEQDGRYVYSTSVDDRQSSTFYVTETERGQIVDALSVEGMIVGCTYEEEIQQAKLWLKDRSPVTIDLSDSLYITILDNGGD
jgi:hypothetical protein